MAKFNVGDKVVYPAHGVAEILSIEIRTINNNQQTFYILSILENSMRVMVPENNIDQIGIREIVSIKEADAVFEILKKREKIAESATWNRRHREYLEKIKSGSIFEVAKVLRDLCILKNDKELSFGERKMLDTVKSLLIRELSLSKGVTHDEIETKLRAIFHF